MRHRQTAANFMRVPDRAPPGGIGQQAAIDGAAALQRDPGEVILEADELRVAEAGRAMRW